MRIEPAGNRILIQRDDVESHDPNFASARQAGIVIPETEDYHRRQAGMDRGIVVALGPTAYADEFYKGSPWCAPGDLVVFVKYSGKPIRDNDTGSEFVVINDADVIAVLRN
jgi:co-chaperonin GroES (HSP10)